MRNKTSYKITILSVAVLSTSLEVSAQLLSLPPLTPQQEALKKSIVEWQPTKSRVAAELPKSVDNSTSKYFPAIFSQGIDNSCSQASGVRYAYTYEVNRLLDRDASMNNNVFGYHFTWNFLNEGNNQGSHAWIGWDLMKDSGTLNLTQLDDRSSYANQTIWPTGTELYTEAMKYRVSSYAKFNLKTTEGINLLRRYLYDHGDGSETGGVATISWETDDWGYQPYKGPSQTQIHYIIKQEGKDGPHAITVVGYDDTVEFDLDGNGTISDNERGAFIFANSWDTYWGTDGKCFIPYSVLLAPTEAGGVTEGDADAYMVTPLIEEPKIVFEVNMSYNRRNELSFSLGVADGSDAKMPAYDFIYPIMNRQGGALPMQGSGKSSQIAFSMNFSRYYERVKEFANPKFFLSVRRTAASGAGTITSFKVRDLITGQVYESNSGTMSLTGGLITMTAGAGSQYYSSCSKWKWLDNATSQPIASPFVVRTAAGEMRKMQIVRYDKSKGSITIRHNSLK
ncbi:MAG: hypothetical protein NC343_03055 [Muribaculum sp.]|nr:hypothetical protein [Muribaculaceae bacterium]MCM1080706.1 hypothetical protein [Muribaculum sp.]